MTSIVNDNSAAESQSQNVQLNQSQAQVQSLIENQPVISEQFVTAVEESNQNQQNSQSQQSMQQSINLQSQQPQTQTTVQNDNNNLQPFQVPIQNANDNQPSLQGQPALATEEFVPAQQPTQTQSVTSNINNISQQQVNPQIQENQQPIQQPEQLQEIEPVHQFKNHQDNEFDQQNQSRVLSENQSSLNERDISISVNNASQPQQVAYKPILQNIQQTQSQPTAQAENIELPQVQAAVAESQTNSNNRQQLNPNIFSDAINTELESDNTQTINPANQTAQQQNQSQQDQNSLMQSSARQNFANTDTNTNSNQQTTADNFNQQLGAALNNLNDPVEAMPTDPVDRAAATARQDFNITGQIVEHAKMIKTLDNTEMVIHLKPEHLGELTLRISVTSNGSVNASFQSENAQVRAMIENTLVQLKN